MRKALHYSQVPTAAGQAPPGQRQAVSGILGTAGNSFVPSTERRVPFLCQALCWRPGHGDGQNGQGACPHELTC